MRSSLERGGYRVWGGKNFVTKNGSTILLKRKKKTKQAKQKREKGVVLIEETVGVKKPRKTKTKTTTRDAKNEIGGGTKKRTIIVTQTRVKFFNLPVPKA